MLPIGSLKTQKDNVIVEAVKMGDGQKYNELVKRHHDIIYRSVYKILKDESLAEDVVQESFLKAYLKIDMFRGQASFRSWLYRIAINTARNKIRSIKTNRIDVEDANLFVNSVVENDVYRDTIRELLVDEIEQLPEKQKTALVLRVFEDLSFKEVASIMRCPYDTAKANYRHAIVKLKSKVKRDDRFQEWQSLVQFA